MLKRQSSAWEIMEECCLNLSEGITRYPKPSRLMKENFRIVSKERNQARVNRARVWKIHCLVQTTGRLEMIQGLGTVVRGTGLDSSQSRQRLTSSGKNPDSIKGVGRICIQLSEGRGPFQGLRLSSKGPFAKAQSLIPFGGRYLRLRQPF